MMKTGKLSAWVFWAAAALAAGAVAWQFARPGPDLSQNLGFYADRGELLLHGVRDRAVSYSMPLLSLLCAARQRLGLDLSLPERLAALLTALAAYGLGARGGRLRGLLYALAAALTGLTRRTCDTEQAVYTLSLMIFLNLELSRQAGGDLLSSAAAGAAAGISMLVRSPLLLFPPLAAVYGFFSKTGRSGKWLAGAALFLLFAYAPLAPWARLNNALFGHTTIFEEERPASNLITGALGMTYTVVGDARAFAGLSRDESAFRWAAKTVLAAPGRYAAAVARRAGRVFLMSPWLFLLAAAGLVLSRSRETRFLAFFCAYFILIHCLLTVEERYFYPLRYVLALLAAAGAWELLERRGLAAGEKDRDVLTPVIFTAAAALTAAALVIVWRYPADTRPPLIAVTKELEQRPGDGWLLKKRGELLLSFNLTAEGRASLARACAARPEADLCYITAALSGEPGVPPRSPERYKLLLVKTLRELELGRRSAAGTFSTAMNVWLADRNAVNGSGADRRQMPDIIKANGSFWDAGLNDALLYFPPGTRTLLLARLSALPGASPGLERVKAGPAMALRGAPDQGDARALLDVVIKGLPGSPVPAGLPGRAGALALALGTAAGQGSLAELLLDCGPSVDGIASLALNSGKPEELAETALKEQLSGRTGCFYPAVRFLALKDGPERAKTAAALEAAAAKSPAFVIASAEILNRSGARPGAGLLADYASVTTGAGNRDLENLALLYQDLGRYGKSLEITAALLKKDPANPELNNNLGVLLLFLNRGKEAEAALLKAAGGSGASASAQVNLAGVYARRGDKADSALYYRRALENPALPAAGKETVRRTLKGLF